MQFTTHPNLPKQLDEQDSLRHFASQFYIPTHPTTQQPAHYFCGNSLGLQPKQTAQYLQQELNDWATLAVEGHHTAQNPWFYYHKNTQPQLAQLIGAKYPNIEVVAMNALTVNLHLLLISFYKPTPQRYKIIIEPNAFPSDLYALQSQVQLHGYNPEDAILTLPLAANQHIHTTSQITEFIEQHAAELALVLLGGVNYYTGQLFDIQAITQATHKAQAIAGFDLAHTIGNVPLQLHHWNVDFATWCSYKYLNSGPGGVAGIFVHHRHAHNQQLHRLAGWWGNSENTRFNMPKQFEPQAGAPSWQLSNAPILPLAAHAAALNLFQQAGYMNPLRQKSLQLTSYLHFLLSQINAQLTQHHHQPIFEIITPNNQDERGCQLSILVQPTHAKPLFEFLQQQAVIADYRNPNVIRFAPVPLYNSFCNVYEIYIQTQNYINAHILI